MKPVVQALLLADHVYQDVTTGKCIICGVFNKLIIRDHPIVSVNSPVDAEGTEKTEGLGILDPRFAGSPYIYLNMIDGSGVLDFVIRYVLLDTDEVYVEMNASIEFTDKLNVVELIIPFIILPRVVGTFALELLYGGEIIGAHKIHHQRQAK